jgi:hypothetical protein
MRAPLCWRLIDAAARDGNSQLVRRCDDMALARWDGMGWVYPASGGVALDFQPVEYYLPEGARA